MKRPPIKAMALVGMLALLVAALPLGIALANITNPVTANYHNTGTGTRFQSVGL